MVWFPLWTGNWEQSSHRWPASGWHHFLSGWSGCDGRLFVPPVGRWEWRKWWVPWTVDVPLAHVEALYNNSKQSHITQFFTNSEKQIRTETLDCICQWFCRKMCLWSIMAMNFSTHLLFSDLFDAMKYLWFRQALSFIKVKVQNKCRSDLVFVCVIPYTQDGRSY